LAKISFLDGSTDGLSIFSPTFLTEIVSFSEDNFILLLGTNFDNTPVSLNSTFLVESPPHPKN
jgi:hypothetical protein